MPVTIRLPVDDPTDPENSWKYGGGGGGSARFNPPGAGVGGTGAGTGGAGGGVGFDYASPEGFDPSGEIRRKRLGFAFGRMGGGFKRGMRPGGGQGQWGNVQQGGQPGVGGGQPGWGGGQSRVDPGMMQRMLAMFGGGRY